MKVLASAALLALCGQVCASDCVVRVAYPDRDRPPYYLGNGPAIPDAPGAGAELLRQAVHATGCTPALVRLPPAPVTTWPTFCTSRPMPETVLQPDRTTVTMRRAKSFFMMIS